MSQTKTKQFSTKNTIIFLPRARSMLDEMDILKFEIIFDDQNKFINMTRVILLKLYPASFFGN